MNQQRAVFLFVSLLCVLSGLLYGSLIDQSQTAYSTTADLHSDGSSGQTFTAGTDGDLIGIRLLLEGAGYNAPRPYGSDFQVNLRTVSAQNVVSQTIVATGYQSKTGIERKTVKWFEILFDQPYHQTEGQRLAFTIHELSGGGSNGWNNYALKSANPYAGGQQFYSFSGSPLSSSTYDMAFETIVVPEPAAIILLSIGALFMKRRENKGSRNLFR
jgi:hypothetical protein